MSKLQIRTKAVRFGTLSLVAGMTVLLSACSTSATGEAGNTALPAADITMNQALHDKVPAKYADGIQVAVFNDWPPDEFVGDDGQLQGWSVDLAKAMSQVLGVDFTYTGTSFDTIIPGLESGRFDAAYASLGPTDERLQVLDFVPERMEGTAYASLTSSNLNVETVADLCGHSVAVLTGAFDFQYLTAENQTSCVGAGAAPMDIQEYKTQNEAELALSSGRIELLAAGSAKLQYLAKQTGTMTVSTLLSNAVYNAIGVRKDDELGASLRDALQVLIDDGTYEAILTKWGVGGQGLLTEAVLATEADPNPVQK